MARAARKVGEGGVEFYDEGIVVPARRGKEAQGGVGCPCLRSHIAVESEVVRLHQEAAAAHGDDVFVLHRSHSEKWCHRHSRLWTLESGSRAAHSPRPSAPDGVSLALKRDYGSTGVFAPIAYSESWVRT